MKVWQTKSSRTACEVNFTQPQYVPELLFVESNVTDRISLQYKAKLKIPVGRRDYLKHKPQSSRHTCNEEARRKTHAGRMT